METVLRARPGHNQRQAWRDLKEFDNHEFIIALSDEASGLRGFIAIHNRNLGMAHGGTRYKAYATEVDALRDVLNLSKAMSYKSALAGLPYGGAKGVIIERSGTNRQAVLEAYARKVEALQGLFHTGTDVGLTDADVAMMANHSHYMLGVGPGDKRGFSTSKAAALGVYYAVKQAAKHRYGSDSLKNKVVGVKGVGKLGGELARLLAADGATLVLADINARAIEQILKLVPNASVVRPADLHKRRLDIYAPCALGQEFTKRTVKDLRCDIIAGGANNQLASESIGDAIFKRGILYAPDYVANAGGLIFVSDELERDGFHLTRVKQRLQHIPEVLETIFNQSFATGLPPHRVAAQLAQDRINGASI